MSTGLGMQIGEIIDRAKDAAGATSDRAFAKHMKVSHGSIANWRSGYSFPDAVSCERLAGLAGIPLAQVLGIVGEARAISREEKAVWRKLAATAVLGAILCAIPLGKTHAATTGCAASSPGMYIMFWRGWLRHLQARLWSIVEGSRGNARSAIHA